MEDPPARVKVMQNAVVLELIAKKMDVEDLRSLRRTCPLWKRSFVPAARDKQEVMTLFCFEDPIHEGKNTLRNYIELVQNSQEIPVAKYLLYDVHAARVDELQHFFELCGSSIRRLDLNSNFAEKVPLDIEKFRRIIFEQTPNLVDLRLEISRNHQPILPSNNKTAEVNHGHAGCARDLPNLRRLKFRIDTMGAPDKADWDPACKKLLADLLRHATGLKYFSGSPLDCILFSNNQEVLSALKDHASPACLSSLMTLKIGKWNVADLELLLELATRRRPSIPLRLQALSISLEYTNERHVHVLEKMYQFLETQASTLRFLSLYIHREAYPDDYNFNPPAVAIQLPTLPVMRRFCINRQHLDCGHFAEDVPMNVKLPGLVIFEYLYNHNGYTGNELDDMDGFGHSGVTDLRLDTNFLLAPEDDDIFQRVYGAGFQFQLVTRLEIWLKPSRQYILTQICAAMPALEVLQVVFRVRSDETVDQEEESEDLDRAKGQGLHDNEDNDHDYDDTDDDTMDLELDSLLSGVSRSNLWFLRQDLATLEGQAGGVNVAALQNILQNRKTEPGLQDLHHLKKLALAIGGGSSSYRLTNAGGYFALAVASPTLQHISIGPGLNTDVYDKQKNGQIKIGRNEWSHWSGGGGVLLSEECQAMSRSVMSPPAILLV